MVNTYKFDKFMVRDREVGCSNHLVPTIFIKKGLQILLASLFLFSISRLGIEEIHPVLVFCRFNYIAATLC
jgi:hypothetical protein